MTQFLGTGPFANSAIYNPPFSNVFGFDTGIEDPISALEDFLGDLFISGPAIDNISAGPGNDTLVIRGSDIADHFNGGAGFDLLDLSQLGFSDFAVIDLSTGTYSTSVNSAILSIENIEWVIGSAADDSISGSIFDDSFWGNFGDDTLIGSGGYDDLRGQGGFDLLDGGTGNDTLQGGPNDDTLLGGGDPDILIGNAGADVLNGGTSVDKADYTISGAGVTLNLTSGGTGGDAMGDSYISIEIVSGSNFGDNLTGSSGNDDLRGRGGSDRLDGSSGGDILDGASGNDTLIGGSGDDTLTGGGQNDCFEFQGNIGADIITDFNEGSDIRDVVRLVGFGANFDTFSEILAATTQVGADSIINLGGGNTITLIGIEKSNLHQNDFVFG